MPPMLILRLGLSDDMRPEVPAEQRSWHLAQDALARESGLEWQTRILNGRPIATMREFVEGQIEEHQPDLVFVCAATYWVAFPSVPLKMRQGGKRFGRRLSKAGIWMSNRPLLADRALFHRARSVMTGSVGHAYYHEPEEALATYEAVIRMVLQREELALGVRGPLPFAIPGSAQVQAESERRRGFLNDGLAELCERLHVPFISYGPQDRHPPEELMGDRIHVTAEGHARRGQAESDAMVRAWRALNDSGD